ncbi:MAG TPA: hypothetical protein PK718_03170 [Candidatus Methanofastidiosa archaeon]|nr:hypothetical protein [Candidatus Methanofastidiosa archaeon]
MSVSGDDSVRILKENMRTCPFLAMAKGIRVYERRGEWVVEVRL